jgi:hypothetical protein
VKSNSVGLQLPGGPFVQVGHVGENCWSRWSMVHDNDGVVEGASLDFNGDLERARELGRTLAELGGAFLSMADEAEDHRAQLREVTM